ncbi:SOS response-associated peptidase [Methylocapsa sp. D3K7]|uniref:SOS response-associated peptidase n=1 Tax=Methylocapsa sp. D3K7 TaxID=3041435 RepID=UPI00244ECF61|nr:SOS response-associated peptidase [Methylocapsa sp. D3K7]WGJ15772.1 SOS response-associated peptidase [Methylocapsa sp. D3K7]
MCGRFTQSYTWRELVELYRLTVPARNLRPRYNIAPTTTIDVLRLSETGPELVPMRWGLIPGWWKKTAKEVPSTFNARVETIAEKPMFRSAFKRMRCIVPASGYYEWRTVEGSKQPYFISAADGAVLSIAGLWDQWKNPATGETISSCTLIITAENDFTRPIHERMPVFLGGDDRDAWLTGKAGVEVLRSAPNDLLRMWPVSTRVNKSGVGDDDASLIEPIGDVAATSPFIAGSAAPLS